MKITLFAVRHKNKVFEFAEPLSVTVEKQYGIWWLNGESIMTTEEFDRSPARVIQAFASTVNMLWFAYAKCNDKKLDKGARALKHEILRFVKRRKVYRRKLKGR